MQREGFEPPRRADRLGDVAPAPIVPASLIVHSRHRHTKPRVNTRRQSLSEAALNLPGMHHPWREFRRLIDWTLEWAHLPGNLMGHTDYRSRVVTLDSRLNQAERRCTIAHETEHIRRGPTPPHLVAREEVAVDRNVARRLLPDIRAVGEALAWARNLDEAADELWVDRQTLEVRLKHLHPAERGWLTQRLEEA